MFYELVKKTRSYRRFDNSYVVSYEDLEELIDTARFTPSSGNRQPMKYMLSCEKKYNDLIFECIGWAGYLDGWVGPSPEQRPSAYILLFTEKEFVPHLKYDPGIVAHTICLAATEMGIASCILGSIDNKKLLTMLNFDHEYEIVLIIALGKGNETIEVKEVGIGDSIKYYRDETGKHIVPKRKIKDIIYRFSEEEV